MLPLANEVAGRQCFYTCLSVILFFGGVSVWCHFLSDCLVPCSFWRVTVPGPMFLLGASVKGGLCEGGFLWRGSLWKGGFVKGVSVKGGNLWKSSLCEGGSLSEGGLCERRGVSVRNGDPPVLTSTGSHWSEQYASYWNAFLC